MFKCINDLAPNYLCNDVTMYVEIDSYDTSSGENMDKTPTIDVLCTRIYARIL